MSAPQRRVTIPGGPLTRTAVFVAAGASLGLCNVAQRHHDETWVLDAPGCLHCLADQTGAGLGAQFVLFRAALACGIS